jgi:protein TonB
MGADVRSRDRQAFARSIPAQGAPDVPALPRWRSVLLATWMGISVTGICLTAAAWSSVVSGQTVQAVESDLDNSIAFPEVLPPPVPSLRSAGAAPMVAAAVVSPSLPGPVPLPVSPNAGARTSPEAPPGVGAPGLAGLSLTGGAGLLLAIPSDAETVVLEEAAVDEPPRAIGERARTYPAEALALQVEGYVQLRIRIDRDGRVQEVRVLDAEPSGVFEGSAVEDARRWLFSPARHDGQAVEVWATSRIDYALE